MTIVNGSYIELIGGVFKCGHTLISLTLWKSAHTFLGLKIKGKLGRKVHFSLANVTLKIYLCKRNRNWWRRGKLPHTSCVFQDILKDKTPPPPAHGLGSVQRDYCCRLLFRQGVRECRLCRRGQTYTYTHT